MQLRKGLPAVLVAAVLTTLAWGSPALGVDNLPGRFTGGGRFASTTGVKMTHGFELYCNAATLPNNLEVNWTGGNHWHMETMTYAACSLRQDPAPPVAPVSVHNGEGIGSFNGLPGYTAEWRIIDNGEPGTEDRIAITIRDPLGNVVITTVDQNGTLLERGNHQAHRLTGRAAR